VVEACSGLRYLFASAMVGTLYAYLSFRRWPRRLAFVLVSLLMPVVANWVRALLIVLLGHYSDNRIATGADHLIYGWVFFGFIMMLMFWVGNRWADAPLAPAAPAQGEPQAAVAPSALPLLLAGLLLLAPPLLLERSKPGAPALPAGGLADLRLPGWQSAPAPELPWKPVFLGAPLHQQTAWQPADGGPPVVLDVAVYGRQEPESKAINSMNELVPATDHRWSRQDPQVGASRWSLREGAQSGLHIQARRLYWVDGRFTRSEVEAKLRGVWQLLAGRGDAQVALVLMTPEQGAAAERLDRFSEALQAPLNGRLQQLLQGQAPHNPAR
jgi:EpsI family protein